MKILHIVPGLDDATNGIAVAAKWIADSQRKAGHDVELIETKEFASPPSASTCRLHLFSEVWVHSMWLPMTLRACWRVLREGKKEEGRRKKCGTGISLVRMTHGCLDPVKIRYHYWKKALVAPFDRWLMAKADRVIATEDDERQWIAAWCPKAKVDMLDLGSTVGYAPRQGLGKRKFLFVGRMHPLKGFDVLLAAIREMKGAGTLPADFLLTAIGKDEKELRAGFEAEVRERGLPVRFLGEVPPEVKESEMATADCLVLPTLSENFALVVKESLERGVPVITTDGAKIWQGHEGVMYIDRFVAASRPEKVRLLCAALDGFMRS